MKSHKLKREWRTLTRLIDRLLLLAIFASALACHTGAAIAKKQFRAGAGVSDITPTNFPVIVNAMFTERNANRAHDPLRARCLVLDDGTTRLAIAVVDTCMMPRDLLDQAKDLAWRSTGIAADHILISATHTHSAPSAMGCLGSRADPVYVKFLPGRIAEGIERAAKNLAPARIGWTVTNDLEHTHNRRWIFRSDKIGADPFGERTLRANMHPGYQNPDAIGPSGPVDSGLSILSVQSSRGRPIALLANYSMHYYDSPLLSADYYGRFADKIGKLVGAGDAEPPFVGIMSQGTSGDLMWMDYSQPKTDIGYDAYAEAIARIAHESYERITYHDWVPLAMREAKLTLAYRVPTEERLNWARKIADGLNGRLPQTLPEVYALEQIYLHEKQKTELKIQALRIGELGIAAIPNEVFAITGLKIKAQSPLQPTFNIELANGAEGYIPPPEQHKLGGYTTWPARTAGLEPQAGPRIVKTVLALLEQVSGKPRRRLEDPHGSYARSVLASKPVAYWRLNEFNGPVAHDESGQSHDATYEDGIAFYLAGPASPAFSGEATVNRCPHFAGGRVYREIKRLGKTYSVEFWFWNGFPNHTRWVTGYLFSRGPDGKTSASGDHLAIGGTNDVPGRLLFFNGNRLTKILTGRTAIKERTWNHVVLVRDGKKVRAYLNGNIEPEISGEAEFGYSHEVERIFIGGSSDNLANLEGKIDEVGLYNRALAPEEVSGHFDASGLLLLDVLDR
ncbi:MAG: LamG-like jellyroll fold domain-containing protein [Verrucomicrobiota bacterium]